MKIVAIVAISLATAACASTQPLNFTPANIEAAGMKLDAALMNVTVALESTKGSTGKKRRVDAGGFEAQVADLWKSALEDSLTRSAIFNDDAHRRVNLSVRILSITVPSGAVVMRSRVSARYELIDRGTGKSIYTTQVDSDGRVPGDYAFMGVTRSRESVNRAVQANIEGFVSRLKSAQLTTT